MITVDLAICFEDGGDCLVNVNVFDKVKLSKQVCVWATQFLHPGNDPLKYSISVMFKSGSSVCFVL